MVSLSARTTTQSALLTLAVATLCASEAQAKDLPGGFIQPGQATAAPRGFVEMCESGTEPGFCSPTRPVVASAALVTAGLSERAGGNASRYPALSSNMTSAPPVIGPVALTPAACPPPPIDPRLGLGQRLNTRLTVFHDSAYSMADGCPAAAPSSPSAATAWQSFTPPDLVQAVARPERRVEDLRLFPERSTERLSNASLWVRPAPCAPGAIASMLAAVSTQLCSFTLPDTPTPPPSVPETPTAAPSSKALPEAELKAMLKLVNHHVNSRVRQRPDAEIYGVGELWRRSGDGSNAVGDCEDLAIEKRAELIAAGFPPDRLAFAVVYSRAAGLHTVLVARTEMEDVVLDGRSPYVTNWSKVPYSWISVQSMNDPMLWYAPAHAQAA
ncbi:transglutaminase-like cysteine peptidase [uncultured Sphingomonas sp.]|uniref:transglutaminase-like cysteine peptidase n=1 Tax=uncultured Sphingomonas sp. TaxID=158754 RepID=UPI003748B498